MVKDVDGDEGVFLEPLACRLAARSYAICAARDSFLGAVCPHCSRAQTLALPLLPTHPHHLADPFVG